jgi:hypothetical protein
LKGYIIYNNFFDVYLYLLINKSIILQTLYNILFNYLRLDILSINKSISIYNILGNKVKGCIVFDLDIIDIEAIKKYGIKGNDINSIIALAPLRYKFNDYYTYNSKIYIYNNIYFLLNYDYHEELTILFLFNRLLFDFFIKQYIYLYNMDIYIIIYIIIYYIYIKILNISILDKGNINYM